jgi:hypothetical protein
LEAKKKEDFAPYRTHEGKHKRATAPTETMKFPSSTESAFGFWFLFDTEAWHA